jgi:hypothetical protein
MVSDGEQRQCGVRRQCGVQRRQLQTKLPKDPRQSILVSDRTKTVSKRPDREKRENASLQLPRSVYIYSGSITLAFWMCSLNVRFTVECFFNVIF